MKGSRNARHPSIWLLTAILTACGGGTTPGSGNKLPEVAIRTADGKAVTADTFIASAGTLKISASDSDGTVKKATYSIDGGAATDLIPSSSMVVTLPALSGGSHTLNVTVTDDAGGSTSGQTTFKVDAAAPVIQNVTLNGTSVKAGSSTTLAVTDAALVNVVATDTRGDTAGTQGPVTITVLDGTQVIGSSTTGTLSLDVSKTAAGAARTAGVVTFTVRATDSVGFTTTGTFNVNFTAADAGGVTTAPTFTWLSPAADFISGGGTAQLRATATRNGQDVTAQITYTATCGTVSGSTWTLGSDCADGSKQTITASITEAGKTYSTTRTVTVDASNPTVQITSPQQGQTFTQNPVKVSVTGSDAVSGVRQILVEASSDGTTYSQIGVVTGSTGDVTWAPMNGTYTLRATATDVTGRTSTTTLGGLTVRLTSTDNQAPTVTALNLPTGTQRGTATATVTVADPAPSSGIAKVELFEGGTSLGVQTTGVAGTYTFSIDTTKLSDGNHTIRAVVTDNVGLSGESSKAFQSDNTSPVLTWNSPTDGSIVKNTITLNATASDATTTTITYTVDGAPVTGPAFTFTTDGLHTITATAKDAAGNTASSSIKVTSDATAPTAQVTSPTSGDTLTSNPVKITVTGNDSGSGVATLEVFANGNSVGTVSGSSGELTWTPTSGTYALTVIATDKAGNRSAGSAPVSVTVKLATTDTTAPVFTGTPTIQPAPTATYSRGTVTIDGYVKDSESGISQVILNNGGSRLATSTNLSPQPDGSTRYGLTFDTSTLADGTYTLTVQAFNGVGLVSNNDISIKVDNTAPNLTWNPPTSAGNAGTLALNATSEAGATITYTASCGTITNAIWNYGTCTDGTTATLTATATDAAGNTTTQTRSVVVDKSAPTVQITSPQTGQKFTQNPISITVSGTDNIAVDHIDVYNGTTKIGTVIGAQGTVTWAAPNGIHTLTAKGYDKAGNESTSSAVNVTVTLTTTDTTAPTGKVTALNNPIKGTVNFDVTATDADSGVATVNLYIDGLLSGNQNTGINGTYTFPVDTTKLKDGTHNVAAVITDNAGNTFATAVIAATVNNALPVITITSPVSGTFLGSNSDLTVKAYTTDATPNDLVTLDYSVDGNAFTSSAPTVPTIDGTHTITVRGTDLAGNTGLSTTTVTFDGTAPSIAVTSPSNSQAFSTAPVDIAATATDNLSGVARMEVTIQGPADPAPVTLGSQQGGAYSAKFTPTVSGSYKVTFTATDVARNTSTAEVRTFTYSVTTPPIEQAPSPKISVVGAAPYRGNMSVNVSGNFDTLSTVDRMILQVTDSKGFIDNSTYVTPQSQATFSVDTTKFANGDLTLDLIAYTKSGLRGTTTTKVTIQNVLNPILAVASPADGASVTTPFVPVRVTLTKNGTTEFTFDPSTLLIELIDYRGQVVEQRPSTTGTGAPSCVASADLATYTCDATFDTASLPADTYSIRATAKANVSGASPAVQSLSATSRFTSNTASVNPPAAVIRTPTTYTVGGVRQLAFVDTKSGFFATVSDNTKINYVEARIVGPYAEGNIEVDGTKQCVSSGQVLGSPVDVLLLNTPGADVLPYTVQNVFQENFDFDGSTYVPDSAAGQRYDLRVTVADGEGNRNIQCVPIKVDRTLAARRPAYTTAVTPSPTPPNTASGKLNYTSATWTLGSIPNTTRVTAAIVKNGSVTGTSFTPDAVGSTSVGFNFTDEGIYEVKWLLEDMTTGIVTSLPGGFVSVFKNP